MFFVISLFVGSIIIANCDYEFIGEGTLITSDESSYYRVAQFKHLGKNITEVVELLEYQCTNQKSCVGYHVNTKKSTARFLEGALLYDAKIYCEEYDYWPPMIPPSWKRIGIKYSWISGSNGSSKCINHLWCGTNKPSETKASIMVNKGWKTWSAFRKVDFEPIHGSIQKRYGLIEGMVLATAIFVIIFYNSIFDSKIRNKK